VLFCDSPRSACNLERFLSDLNSILYQLPPATVLQHFQDFHVQYILRPVCFLNIHGDFILGPFRQLDLESYQRWSDATRLALVAYLFLLNVLGYHYSHDNRLRRHHPIKLLWGSFCWDYYAFWYGFVVIQLVINRQCYFEPQKHRQKTQRLNSNF